MHARSRKLALAEASTQDEITDAFPSDDAVVIEIASFVEETRANERICLECGGDGSRHEGCSHGEVARLHEPSRAAGEMVARLRRAAAEHRAASRALRALVTSELGRGRAELETTAAAAAMPLSNEDEDEGEAAPAAIEAAVAPCPRCAEREVEGASASVAVNTPRAARKRGRAVLDQQTFPFLKETVAESESLSNRRREPPEAREAEGGVLQHADGAPPSDSGGAAACWTSSEIEKSEVASSPTLDLATPAHAPTPEPLTPHEPPAEAAVEPPPVAAKPAPRRPRSLRA